MINTQYITHENTRFDYLQGAEMALRGGCKWVQLRMKEASDEEFICIGRQLSEMCKAHGATFLLDDRVHLVRQLGADGVHLGKNDMPVDEARKLFGDTPCIIGGTANTFSDIERLYQQGADYIGCGPFRYTETKKNLAPTLGLEGYKELLAKMKARGIGLPLIAIGGILRSDVKAIIELGVSGIAVSGAVLNAVDPIEEMKLLINLM